MTKIRCQVCGGENLHTEGSVLVVCDNCGNRSYVIPESAITEIESPVECDIVTVRYNRRLTDCPRKSFCLNDKMDPCSEPCQRCKVVEHIYGNINTQLNNLHEARQAYLEAHPELMNTN